MFTNTVLTVSSYTFKFYHFFTGSNQLKQASINFTISTRPARKEETNIPLVSRPKKSSPILVIVTVPSAQFSDSHRRVSVPLERTSYLSNFHLEIIISFEFNPNLFFISFSFFSLDYMYRIHGRVTSVKQKNAQRDVF